MTVARFVVFTVTLVFAAGYVRAASAESRITNATTVRLRSGSSTTAPIVSELAIGTELAVLERTAQGDAWYRVRTNDGLEGWVLGSLTAFGRGDSDPYRGWIRAHQDAARYDEPGGRWMVDPAYVMQIHDKYRDTDVADDIAWFFVQNGLFGECEGDVPCYVGGQNTLNGEYLRLHPNGGHVDESNTQIALGLNDAMDNLLAFPKVLQEFDPSKRCTELHVSLDPLAAAVTASTSTRKANALAAIDRFAQLCR